MSSSVAGDYEVALGFTDSEPDQEESVKGLSEGVDSGIDKDEKYKIKTTEIDGNSATVKIIVDDNDSRYVNLGLEKKEGDWLIISIVYNLTGDNSENSTENISDNEKIATMDVKDTPKQCLPSASVEKQWYYSSGWSFYFQPDSSSLSYPDAAPVSINQMKEFYEDNSQYEFYYVIDVSLYLATGSQSDIDLANSRAYEVGDRMVDAGISASRIRLGTASGNGSSGTPQNGEISRYAYVKINSSCDVPTDTEDLPNLGR
ncbi:MAG: hypothetical protein QG628_651 [Patescibacteria group bacterium]|nr:hypothetical protein [Patescibacteria group bacterium]